MKLKFFITFVIGCVLFFSAIAQQQKIKFSSKSSFGISIGQNGTDILFQTVNGITVSHWFSGIGFGADYYQYKSYPLFIDVKRYFSKNDKIFAYTDLGYNFSGKDKPGKEIYYYSTYHFSGGVYNDIGLGYKLKFSNRSFFIFSAGFNYKEVNNKIGIIKECLIAPCPVDYSKYRYGNGKVILKAGVDF